ncbi:hypothetical protein NFJ02_15g19810 [Pycnococcus provasolii]
MGGPGNRDVPRSLSLRKLASQPPPHAAQCNADVDDDDDYWDFEPTPQLMKVTTTTTPAPARAEQPASSLVPASPSNLYGAATSSDAAAGAAPAPLQEERVPASPVAAQECPMHVNDVASEGDDDNNDDDDDDDDDEGLQWGGESDSDGALDSFDGPREGAGDFAWDDEDDEHQRQPQHQHGDAHGEFGAPSQLDVERYDNYAHDFDYDDVEEKRRRRSTATTTTTRTWPCTRRHTLLHRLHLPLCQRHRVGLRRPIARISRPPPRLHRGVVFSSARRRLRLESAVTSCTSTTPRWLYWQRRVARAQDAERRKRVTRQMLCLRLSFRWPISS